MYSARGAVHGRMEGMRRYLCRSRNARQVREITTEALHELIGPVIYDAA
jgi:hypothetical protein